MVLFFTSKYTITFQIIVLTANNKNFMHPIQVRGVNLQVMPSGDSSLN